MDARTLSKMTVSKLREEALKFGDLQGVHGMNKPELLKILKQKYGIVEEQTESEILIERKHVLKEKIRKLKAEKEQAIANKDKKKAALLRKRLHDQRRILRKVVKKVKA